MEQLDKEQMSIHSHIHTGSRHTHTHHRKQMCILKVKDTHTGSKNTQRENRCFYIDIQETGRHSGNTHTHAQTAQHSPLTSTPVCVSVCVSYNE